MNICHCSCDANREVYEKAYLKGLGGIVVVLFGLIAIFITIFSIEAKLRKSNEQNEEIIELLKEIKEK